MIKMKTALKKDPNNLSRVLIEIQCKWAYDEGVSCHMKMDGTSCMVLGGILYKRYDAKLNKKTGEHKVPPAGSIPCCDADHITGHWPHWSPCNKNDKWHLEVLSCDLKDGTYELVGPKINGNNQGLTEHKLLSHSDYMVDFIDPLKAKEVLENLLCEGVVYHHPDGRMCKLRRKDFGLSWPVITD